MKVDIPNDIQNLLLENNGIISSSQAKNLGRYAYYRVLKLVRDGVLFKIRNGLFIETSRLASPMIDINRMIPSGVLCLYSAWFHYGLTTQIPADFNIAVDRNVKVSLPDYPPVRLMRWSGKTYTLGIDSAQIGGCDVRIYDIEKSVCDAVKFRNKVGIDVMSEVLKNYFLRPQRNIVRLENYARQLRVYTILEKYLEIEL